VQDAFFDLDERNRSMRVPPYQEKFDRPPVTPVDQLNWDDLDLVNKLLAEIAPTWSAELHHASATESTIVVTPEGANDLIGPAFVLHQSPKGIALDQFRWDEYRKLGEFHFFSGALTALRSRLVPLVSRHLPAPRI
jgi:hypothetical protein